MERSKQQNINKAKREKIRELKSEIYDIRRAIKSLNEDLNRIIEITPQFQGLTFDIAKQEIYNNIEIHHRRIDEIYSQISDLES